MMQEEGLLAVRGGGDLRMPFSSDRFPRSRSDLVRTNGSSRRPPTSTSSCSHDFARVGVVPPRGGRLPRGRKGSGASRCSQDRARSSRGAGRRSPSSSRDSTLSIVFLRSRFSASRDFTPADIPPPPPPRPPPPPPPPPPLPSAFLIQFGISDSDQLGRRGFPTLLAPWVGALRGRVWLASPPPPPSPPPSSPATT